MKKFYILFYLFLLQITANAREIAVRAAEIPAGFTSGLQSRFISGATYYEMIDTWEEIPQSGNIPIGRHSFSFFEDVSGNLYSLFGNTGYTVNDIFGYAFTENGWLKYYPAQAPEARKVFNGVYSKELQAGLVFGGQSSSGDYLSELVYFYPETGTVFVYSTDVTPRNTASFIAGDFIYLFSGQAAGSVPLQDFFRVNIKTRQEENLVFAGISPKIRYAAAYSELYNRALLFGGIIDDGFFATPDPQEASHLFDPENLSFSEITGILPSRRSDSALISYDKKELFVLFGGYGPDPDNIQYPFSANIILKDTWLFRYPDKKWVKRDPKTLPEKRMWASGIYSSKLDRPLIYGGFTGQAYMNDLWIYNLSSTGSISGILDTGSSGSDRFWQYIIWDADVPPGCAMDLYTQAVNSADEPEAYNGPVTISGSSIPSPSGKYRYLKWRLDFRTTDYLENVSFREIKFALNSRPLPPGIARPISGQELLVTLTLPLDIVLSPGSDDDGDGLTYSMELSGREDFSAPVFSTSGITLSADRAFTYGASLSEGRYWLRARSFDGQIYSEWNTLYFTNLPDVRLNYPNSQSLTVSGDINVSFDVLNKSPEAAHNYSIYLSTFLAGPYSVFCGSGALETAPLFVLNTNRFRNGDYYGVKVVISSVFGSGTAYSLYNFSINNPNYPPEVELLRPSGGEVFSGGEEIIWRMSDRNLADSHKIYIGLSYDGGVSYPNIIASGLSGTLTSYFWITNRFDNDVQCRVGISATDDGIPAASGEGKSAADFTLINLNRPPADFLLIHPVREAVLNLKTVIFDWEDSFNPLTDLGDYVLYSLFLSTAEGNYTEYINLTVSSYTLTLPGNTHYSWYVEVYDTKGLRVKNTGTAETFEITDKSARSSDGNCELIFDSIISEGDAVRIFSYDLAGDLAKRARGVTGFRDFDYNTYSTSFSGPGLSSSHLPSVMKLYYKDDNNDGMVDGTRYSVDSLRLAYYEDGRWGFLENAAGAGPGKYLSAAVSKPGLYSIKVLSQAETGELAWGLKNYPNPFNPGLEKTKIIYYLAENSEVTAEYHTLSGGLVRKENIKAGEEGGLGGPSGYENRLSWDGRNGQGQEVSGGVYILRITARAGGKEKQLTRKIAVSK